MIVRVTLAGGPTLEAPEDLKAFKLVAPPGLHGAELARALGEAGRLEGDHAWIAPAWLHRASHLGEDPAWRAGLATMTEFAAKHGWVDAATGAIRAHIEREPAP